MTKKNRSTATRRTIASTTPRANTTVRKRLGCGALLRALGAQLADPAPGAATRKRTLLEALRTTHPRSKRDVIEMQRMACFLLAFPGDANVLRAARALADVLPAHVARLPRAQRERLDDTGIAGTTTRHYYAAAAVRWLIDRFGANVDIDWPALTPQALDRLLEPLWHPLEREAVEITPRGARAWFDRARGAAPTALAWVIAQASTDAPGRARFTAAFESAELQLAWHLGDSAAAITHNRLRVAPVFRADGMRRAEADAVAAVTRPQQALERVSRAQARRVLDVWRAALWSRTRTVLHIERPNLDECYLADFGGGLQMAAIGIEPAARGLLEASYGYLLLANGMPFGYGGFTPLFAQVNTGTNVFPEFRGSEAAFAFQQALRTMHTLTGNERFLVNPYQFGAGNDEALQSGAYWFYFRLGFRSVARPARDLAQREFERMRADRRYRVPLPTLRRLAACDMVLDLAPTAAAKFFDERKLVVLAERVATVLAATGVASRAGAQGALARSVAAVLGVDLARWPAIARRGFALTAPLLAQIEDLARWSDVEKRGVAGLLAARWATEERDYVNRVREHDRLREALGRAARHARRSP